MCAIVGSFDKEVLAKLIDLNSYRGNHSYSLLEYNWKKKKIERLTRGFGDFDYELLTSFNNNGNYLIAHTQSPTTSGVGFFNIHPSEYNDTLLWHNGILKEDYIKELQKEYAHNVEWDTRLLHYLINKDEDLSNINGTFSCVYYDQGELFLFRNEISPMFFDDDMNLSSTKFENSIPTKPNQILKISFNPLFLEFQEEFTTNENPYYFG